MKFEARVLVAEQVVEATKLPKWIQKRDKELIKREMKVRDYLLKLRIMEKKKKTVDYHKCNILLKKSLIIKSL